MARQRVQVDSGLRPAHLQPVAAPVDTFVRTDAGTKLSQLAQGLAQIAPEVRQFTGTLIAEHDQRAREQGVAAARDLITKLRAEHKTLKQAIKEGLIPKNSSPFFMAGLREQMGRVMADRFHDQFIVDMASDPTMQHTTKLDDFDTFLQQKRDEWVKANLPAEDAQEPFFSNAFGSRVEAYATRAREQFAVDITKRVSQLSVDAIYEEARSAVEDSMKNGASVENIAAGLQQMVDARIAQGEDGKTANIAAAQGIIAAAESLNSLDALSVLEHMRGGVKGSNLSRVREIEDRLTQAKERIGIHQQQQHKAQQAAEAEARTKRINTIMTDAYKSIAAAHDRSAVDLTQTIVQLGAEGDEGRTAAASLVRAQSALIGQQFNTEEGLKDSLLQRIWTTQDVTPATLADYVGERRLTAGDAAWLNDRILEWKASQQTGTPENDILSDRDLRDALAGMPARFTDSVPTVDQGDATAHAKELLKADFLRWRLGEGKDAKRNEIIEKISQLADRAVHDTRTFLNVKVGADVPAPFDKHKQEDAKDWTQRAWVDKATLTAIIQGKFTPDIQNQLRYAGVPASDMNRFVQEQLAYYQQHANTP